MRPSWCKDKFLTVSATDMGLILTRGMSIYYFHFLALVIRQNAALSSDNQHIMPPEFGGNWAIAVSSMPGLRFSLPCYVAGYSVKINY